MILQQFFLSYLWIEELTRQHISAWSMSFGFIVRLRPRIHTRCMRGFSQNVTVRWCLVANPTSNTSHQSIVKEDEHYRAKIKPNSNLG